MAIGEKKGGGTWWKVLLGVLGGFFLGIGAVAGGAAIAGAVVPAKTFLGGEENANKYLTKEFQEKTILQIVQEAMGGKLKFDTIGDLNNITPMVGEYITGVKNSLNGIGTELTNEDMYKWPLATLSDSIIGAVKDAKLIRVLSKDNLQYPDPVIKYLSYETYPEGHESAGEYVWAKDENGNYIYDENNEHVLVNLRLKDMLDDANFIQRKVDSMRIKMLFTEGDIANSSLLTAIKDKSVRQLAQNGAFDDVKISAVFKVEETSPQILKTFVKKEVTIGGMSNAINNLKIDEVMEIDESSPAILRTFQDKGVTVNGMSDAIDDLKLGEVMDLKEGDLLYKLRNDKIDELKNVDEKLTVDDVFPDRSDMKFIKYLPGDTVIKDIGTEVNNIKLTKAFEDNIFSGEGSTLNSTWKYMLIEDDEEWIAGSPTKDSNPFASYKCKDYTVGGDGVDPNPKGINALIDNMSANMSRASLSQLNTDKIVELDDDFLTRDLGAWKALVPEIAANPDKVKFGDLTLKELSAVVTAATASI